MSLRSIRRAFADPPRSHRPLAVWTGKATLDEALALARLNAGLDAGMGGAVVEARPPGCGDAYRGLLQALAKQARRNHATLALYETYSLAGDTGREDAMHFLRLSESPLEAVAAAQDDDGAARFMFAPAHGGLTSPPRIRPVLAPFDPALFPGWRGLTFRPRTASGRPNLLRGETAQRYIREVLDPHYAALRKYFGSSILHLLVGGADFDTEPGELPWDPDLPEIFEETCGYALGPHLPALFFDVPGARRVRADFWRLITALRREAFEAPIAAWCAAKGVTFSPHSRADAPPRAAIHASGSFLDLRACGARQVVDVSPGAFLNDVEPGSSTARAFSILAAGSVDRLLGQGGLMCGAAAPADTASAPEFGRAAANQFFALGAAFLGLRQDADPAQSQLPAPIAPLCDYIGRMSWILGQGIPRADVAILFPEGEARALFCAPRSAAGRAALAEPFRGDTAAAIWDNQLLRLSNALLDAQIPFDFLPEELLIQRARAGHKALLIGNQRYAAVIIPSAESLAGAVAPALLDFAISGGAVLSIGTAPGCADQTPSEELARFIERYAVRIADGPDRFDYSKLIAQLERRIPPQPMFLDAFERREATVHILRRQWDTREIILSANTGAAPIEGNLVVPAEAPRRYERWDADTGQIFEIPSSFAPPYIARIPLTLAPYGTCVVVGSPAQSA